MSNRRRIAARRRLENDYRRMARDLAREAAATEWTEALLGDFADERAPRATPSRAGPCGRR